MNKKLLLEKTNIAIDVAKEIDPEYRIPAFKTILSYLLQGESVGSIVKPESKSLVESKLIQMTLPEILATIKPTTYTDKAILTAYYLFQVENEIKFNAQMIKEELRKAKSPQPANMTDVLNSLIKKGLLRESTDMDGKKGFEITEKGKKYAEDLFTTSKDA